MVSVAAPMDVGKDVPTADFGQPLEDAAGTFMLQLLATARQLNSRAEAKFDQIDQTLKDLYRVIDLKADQTELDDLTVKVKTQETHEIVAKMADIEEEIKTLEKMDAHQGTVGRVDKLEESAKQLFDTLELKAFQQDMAQVTADITAVVATKADAKAQQTEVLRIDKSLDDINTTLTTKADHQTALDLIATLRVKANQQDLEELAVRVSAAEESMDIAHAAIDTKADHGGVQENSASLVSRCEAISAALDKKATEIATEIHNILNVKADKTEVQEVDQKTGEISVALNTKANRVEFQELSSTLGAKANRQELRRQHRVVTINNWRVGQKLFQQAAGCVVNDYRATMAMDIGYRYHMALQVIDHNRQQGPFVEAAVALLPESSSAWMNCDWGTGKGWAADGTFPGVGLMNLHGQQKSHILTSGDVLDIKLDHYTGQHVVEFRKRGSDVHCRRRVAPQPLNLVMSMWGRAGLELIEFDVVDVS
jgi:hypothetical protein